MSFPIDGMGLFIQDGRVDGTVKMRGMAKR